jgi:hypothetical protein
VTEEITWVPLSVIAQEYKRDIETIRRWAHSGLLVEVGFTVRRDLTGHWSVGVPPAIYSTFTTKATPVVVNPPHTM